jgi:hypothetical protein
VKIQIVDFESRIATRHVDFASIDPTISRKPAGVWGCVSAIDSRGRTIWIVDAHRGNGKRFVVHADELLTAFMELEARHWRVRTLPFAVALWEQTGRIRCMKYLQIPLVILATLSSSLALADDFKTVAGKEYKDVTVNRVEPDGILVKTKSGISKVYFVELPKEVQERFHYDPQTATAYSTQQAANYEVYQKQQEEAHRRQQDADAKNNAAYLQQQAINRNAQASQDREMIRGQEKALQQANRARPEHTPRYTTVLHRLPAVHSQPAVHSEPSPQSNKSTKSNKK